MAKVNISACIMTHNEEENIRACLESVKWAEEIIVVDSGSTDRTCDIAKEYTDRIVQHKWEGHIGQRNFVISLATKDWVFCLDADERCTPDLAKDIERVVTTNEAEGYYVKRHTYYLSRWINHCGWYPDYKLRLAKRGLCKSTGTDPHDSIVVNGRTKKLDSELHHFTYRDFADQIRTINNFSDITRDQWIKEDKRPSIPGMLFHPMAKFFEIYFYKLGFLDGVAGFVIAASTSFYVFCKYVKLWETTLPRNR
jgi:glycosyltransferase involved in cell wall biosynthesis